MNRQKKNIDTLIRKALCEEATEEEKQALEIWLNSSETNRESFLIIKQLWEHAMHEPELPHSEQTAHAIWQKAMTHRSASTSSKPERHWHFYLKIAAIFCICCLAGLMTYWLLNNTPKKAAGTMVFEENPEGQKSKIILPDSSVVWLNAASAISYLKPFSDTLRQIELQGEAYFEVKPDKARPFVVKTRNLLTTALGTSFNITYDVRHQHIQVALITGKVSVEHARAKAEQVVLLPGKGIQYHEEAQEFTNYTFDTESVLAWKNNILLFEKDDFNTFKSKIEKWYGVEVEVIGQPSRDWQLTGRYENVSLDKLLQNIQFNKKFTYSLTDKRLMINFKK